MTLDGKIYVAGHRGLVGSAIVRRLVASGYRNIVTRTHKELDLVDQKATFEFFDSERPDWVFLAAAKVGGIYANSKYPADFIYKNLAIETNVIEAARRAAVKKLLFLGSSCIYPKHAPQPLKEEYLLTGPLEPTNEPYAVAKIAGIKLCAAYNSQFGTNFICAMPTNLYGPGDNYDLEKSHVIPALIRKMHEAKEAGSKSVELWGSGTARREFLYSDDVADACIFLMQSLDFPAIGELINVGAGRDLDIRQLAELIAQIVGFSGGIVFNSAYPDGTPRKLLDVSRLKAAGWVPQVPLEEGVQRSYADFLSNRAHVA